MVDVGSQPSTVFLLVGFRRERGGVVVIDLVLRPDVQSSAGGFFRRRESSGLDQAVRVLARIWPTALRFERFECVNLAGWLRHLILPRHACDHRVAVVDESILRADARNLVFRKLCLS
jgi:hypothetical protein